MSWNCTLDNQGTSSAKGLSIGQKFNLYCQGSPVPLSAEFLQISADPPTEDPVFGKLYLIQTVKLEPASAELVVTSYVAGSHRAEGIVLTDGKEKVSLTGFEWDVASTVGENPQATPYPSYGPWMMSIGWYYWVILISIIFMLVWKLVKEFNKFKVRKKLFEELENYKTARPPYEELHSELRKLERNLDKLTPEYFVSTLEKNYRLYLIRELEVPALDWSDKEIVKEIKKRHRKIYPEIKNDLIDYFSELRKIKSNLKKDDCVFLLKHCQKISDKISEIMEKINAKEPR